MTKGPSVTHIDFKRLFDIIPYQQRKIPQQKALNSFESGTWKSYSIDEIQSRVDIISCWLLSQGYEKGTCVVTIPRMGSPLWMMIDFACQQIGLILVPVHPTASVEEIAYMLQETEAPLCITLDEGLYYKVLSLQDKAQQLKRVYHLQKNATGYLKVLDTKVIDKSQIELLQIRKAEIEPEDTLVIMYTSGTSGTPKGVVLSHDNLVSNIKSILSLLPLQPGQRVLSFLPFSHIFERSSCFAYMAFGLEVYFANSLDTLSHDFNSVRPSLCTTVPRTLEKMYDILQQRSMEGSLLKRNLIQWAIRIGKQYKEKRGLKIFFRIKLFFARILVLSVWRRKLGGKLKYMIVGAAALRPEIGRLFSAGGILTLSGYGMTETSPFLTVNRTEPGLNRFGTVGLPVPGVQVKIDNPDDQGEGEILVSGPNVMQGYYKRPDLTAEVFTADKWLRTGDVGKIVSKKFLMITDRKKDIFKTSTGKYVAPQPIENQLHTSTFIYQSLVVGFNKPYVVAILVPNFELLQAWCVSEGIHWTAPNYMVHNIKVIRKMQEEVDLLNDSLQSHERIRKFILSDAEWTVEGKDLTPSFKLKRSLLAERYKAAVEKLYQ
jgi:long-chain acyl-CoA synthetase